MRIQTFLVLFLALTVLFVFGGRNSRVGTKVGRIDRVSWDHLTGINVEQVESQIHLDRPDVKIFRVPVGAMVTADFREDRVRIFVNEDGKVMKAPRIG